MDTAVFANNGNPVDVVAVVSQWLAAIIAPVFGTSDISPTEDNVILRLTITFVDHLPNESNRIE